LLVRKRIPAGIDEAGSPVAYLRNEMLETVRSDYPGNPMIDGRFLNENFVRSDRSFGTVFKWFLSQNPQRDEKKGDTWRLTVRTPDDPRSIKNDCLIWLGHASFLLHIEGRWLITDPCLTHPPLQERLAPLPVPINRLDFVDYLLLSHGHYDHLDAETIGQWPSQDVQALVPLRMGPLIESMNKFLRFQEAGWYQQFRVEETFTITFLPAQHWYLRVPWDRNKILWGGFLLQWKNKKLFFAGDTAYAQHFARMRELFGPIDYCLMPIAAYKPEYVMKSNHTNPLEAVHAFHDLGGGTLFPMHYGTFDLADEPLGEPLRWLRELEQAGAIRGRLAVPDPGEVVYL
jgi:L-ascorbate metabolism protein UlaG (beta-lactamase superfamily)